MEKTKIYSALLDRELEVEKRGKRYIIKHAVLEKLSNDISGLKYKLNIVVSDPTHAVVVCEMRAGEQLVSTIGESTSETLWADAEKNYPVTMAWNRAFDRALIRILDFGDLPVYSNKEIQIKQTKQRKEPLLCQNIMPELPTMSELPTMAELSELPDSMSEVFEDYYMTRDPIPGEAYESNQTERPQKTTKKVEYKKSDNNRTSSKKVKPDDIILFGRWKGYRFKEIKDTKEYSKFLAWVRSEDVEFADPKKKEQFDYFKEIADAARR